MELINEYYKPTATWYTKMQELVTYLRGLGYTNTLVSNKLTWVDGRNNWQAIADPEDKWYDGYHVYMIDENYNTIVASMQHAYDLGIKVLNTECGPATLKANFTSTLVNQYENFIEACNDLGFGVASWLSQGANDWYPVYLSYGMTFPPATEVPPPPEEPPIPPLPEEEPPTPSPPPTPPPPTPEVPPSPETPPTPEVPPTPPTVGLPEDLPTPLSPSSKIFSQALLALSKYQPMTFDQKLKVAARYKPLTFEEILRVVEKMKVA